MDGKSRCFSNLRIWSENSMLVDAFRWFLGVPIVVEHVQMKSKDPIKSILLSHGPCAHGSSSFLPFCVSEFFLSLSLYLQLSTSH